MKRYLIFRVTVENADGTKITTHVNDAVNDIQAYRLMLLRMYCTDDEIKVRVRNKHYIKVYLDYEDRKD